MTYHVVRSYCRLSVSYLIRNCAFKFDKSMTYRAQLAFFPSNADALTLCCVSVLT